MQYKQYCIPAGVARSTVAFIFFGVRFTRRLNGAGVYTGQGRGIMQGKEKVNQLSGSKVN